MAALPMQCAERLRDAFIAALMWNRLGDLGGPEVGEWLAEDIEEAFAELCEFIADWDLRERLRWACFTAAQRWMERHGAAVADELEATR